MLQIRLVLLGFILAIAMCAGLAVGWLMPRPTAATAHPDLVPGTATLIQEIQELSELITVKYVLEKVIVLEDVRWYGDNRVLLLAHGVVKAGVDLRLLEPDHLVLEAGTIHISLPHGVVTDVYLDEHKTRVIEHSTGLLRAFDKDLQMAARRQAIDELRRTARHTGIHEDARDRAHQVLSGFFSQMGLDTRFQ